MLSAFLSHPSRSTHTMMRTGLALAALLAILSGCAVGPGTSTTTSSSLTCLESKPETRDWLRDRVAITLQIPSGATLPGDEELAKLVATTVQQLPEVARSQASLVFLGPAVRVGQSVVIFYRLQGNNVAGKCDSAVQQVVNGINQALSPKLANPNPDIAATNKVEVHLTPIPVTI